MSNSFLETIKAEWAVIRDAPLSFATASVAVGAIIWFFLSFIFSATISGKDSTIQSLNTQLSAYKDKLNGATPEEARARFEALEKKIENITHAPSRRLDDAQKSDVRRVFEGRNNTFKLIIVSVVSGTEPERYARDFIDVFEELNYSVIVNNNSVPLHDDDKGLMVGVVDHHNVSGEAKLFINALHDAGLRPKQVQFKPRLPLSVDYDLFIGERDTN